MSQDRILRIKHFTIEVTMRNRVQMIQKAMQETRPKWPKLMIQEESGWKVR